MKRAFWPSLLLAALVGLMGYRAYAQAEEHVAHEHAAVAGEHPAPSAPAEHAAPAHGAPTHGEHAAPAHGGGHGEEELDTPGYIVHHVADNFVYEFEMPGPLYSGHNPQLDLGKMFGFLRFELKPGACAVYAHASGMELWKELFGGCVDLRPTKHVLMMLIASVLLLVIIMLSSNRDPKKLVPKGAGQNLVEMLVCFVRDELAEKNIGKEEAPRYTPYLLSVFFFILAINLLGLIPWMATATGNIAITCALATCTWVLTQAASIRAAGIGGYFKHLTGGVHWALWVIMVPVEILGLFTKPFALTMRLFANMLAGHIVLFFLLALIFMLHPGMALVSVPMAVAIYFLELFVAFLQAYVFTMLSALFIGTGVAMGHHGDHGHESHGHEKKDAAHAH